jgi:phospholipid/cholesterol/gamma-HCH transport system substrate-binding protein
MNRQPGKEIQVGIMVVIGIVILIGGLMFFKRINLRADMVGYAVDIPAVEGLRRGDRVQVRGIRVGQVTSFEFLPGTVRVKMEIEDWVQLGEDSDVVLVMKGLVGEVLLEIEPGRGEPVPPGHVFQGRSAASMLALGDKVNDALEVMTGLGEEMRRLLVELREEDRIWKPLDAAERTLEAASDLIEENRIALNTLVGNLNALSATFEDAFGEGKLDTTLHLTRHTLASLDSTLVELRAVTAQGRAILTGLEQGEGSAGLFLKDPTLYARADSTLHSLDRLLDQMRRNPKAMFRMSIF